MTFRTKQKERYKKNLLADDKFAEDVTFTKRSDGADRTVRMSVTVRQEREDDQRTEDHKEVATVFCLTDESDSDVGGVAEFKLGDKIVRSSTFDPNSTPFTFNGTVIERGEHYIRVEMDRKIRRGQGRGQARS